MNKCLLLMLLFSSSASLGQNAADAYYDPVAMQKSREMTAKMHGETINTLLIGERLENQVHDGDSSLVWEVQGWIGKDINKLWVKTEGESHGESAELQALWSHAISPFWDFQAGLRHDFEPAPSLILSEFPGSSGSNTPNSRDYAVIGLMGLAPYWFEVDAAAFVSDEGDVSTRLEAEYELRLTQRLILQPRLELNYAFSDDLEAGVGQGMNKAELGLRLRYEFKREFAPYIGVAWEKSYGHTADLLQAQGKDVDDVSFVAGLRFWY